jgi:hypothetical protein
VAVADVNGDGHGDILVGAPDSSFRDEGRVLLYLSNPLTTTRSMTLGDGRTESEFGFSVANAGDVDGNGLVDVLVGAPGSGRAYLYLSQAGGGFNDGPVFYGEGSDDRFGDFVSGAGDFNYDGVDDLLVGAKDWEKGFWGLAGKGKAYLFYGGLSLDFTADAVFEGDFVGDHLGSALAGLGDLNRDGIDDILIGADGSGFSPRGHGRVYFGGQIPDAIPDLILRGESSDAFGSAVAGAGNVDGDESLEFLIGAPGNDRTYVSELALPDFGDCNLNGTLDMCDILSGSSADGDANGYPDECAVCGSGALSLVLAYDTVTGIEAFEACYWITVGPEYAVDGSGAQATLTAPIVVLESGVSVGRDSALVVSNGTL